MLHHLWQYLFLGSLIGDIGGWLSKPYKKIAELAGAVWKAIKHLWSTVAGVFQHVGGAWVSMWHALGALDRALSFLADSTRNALKWIIHNLNPKTIGHAISKATSWAAREISKAAHSLSSRITGIYSWAKRTINSVSHRLTGIYRYLVSKANEALHWIGHQGKRMWTLLQSAQRLAAWLVGALITPLFRYIVGHIEALAITIGRWMLANIGKLALDLERAIARIF